MDAQKIKEAQDFISKLGVSARSHMVIIIDANGSCQLHTTYAGLSDLSFMIMVFKNYFYQLLNQPSQATSGIMKKTEEKQVSKKRKK